MSNAPFYAYGMRSGVKFGDQTLVDGLIKDGLWCSFCDVHMGGHAEYTAKKAGDHAAGSRTSSRCSRTRRRSPRSMRASSRTRSCPSRSRRRRARPSIDADEVAAARHVARVARQAASRVSEGCAEGHDAGRAHGHGGQRVGAQRWRRGARRHEPRHSRTRTGSKVLARITGYATGGGEPQDLFFAPIIAVQNLMAKMETKIGDYDLIEANEAFASQALADGAALGWDWDRVNVNGGAIALGHPIGASGARVLTTLAVCDAGSRRSHRARDTLSRRRQRRRLERGENVMTSLTSVVARDRQLTVVGVVGFAATMARGRADRDADSRHAGSVHAAAARGRARGNAVSVPWPARRAWCSISLAGALGAPVFAPIGAPGVLRLIGPTGGYLLAAPGGRGDRGTRSRAASPLSAGGCSRRSSESRRSISAASRSSSCSPEVSSVRPRSAPCHSFSPISAKSSSRRRSRSTRTWRSLT